MHGAYNVKYILEIVNMTVLLVFSHLILCG
jgi:hypothetical protein